MLKEKELTYPSNMISEEDSEKNQKVLPENEVSYTINKYM